MTTVQEEARAAARFWVRTLGDCECPEEVYPTGDRRTLHEPFCSTVLKNVGAELERLAGEAERLREALERIAGHQQKTLTLIRSNGFVFEDIGSEPGNWQHLAFTIYNVVCEIDSDARAALEAAE